MIPLRNADYGNRQLGAVRSNEQWVVFLTVLLVVTVSNRL